MGGIEDGGLVEDGTAAHVRVEAAGASLKRDLEGERVGCNFRSTDNLVLGDETVVTVDEHRNRETRKNHALRGGCVIK